MEKRRRAAALHKSHAIRIPVSKKSCRRGYQSQEIFLNLT